MKNGTFILLIALLLAGCARSQPHIVKIPEPLEESRSPQLGTHTAGSLWSSDRGSMFADQKARQLGDIVTVVISETASASKEATTSTGRTTNMTASIPHLFGLENSSLMTDRNNQIDLSNLVGADFANTFDGKGTTTRKGSLTASLTTQVIQRYPNGNLKIRGGKEVMVNDEVQILYLTGIVRPVDITAANTVLSSKILNARITYTGEGAVSDKQQPGWLMRTLDMVWPF